MYQKKLCKSQCLHLKIILKIELTKPLKKVSREILYPGKQSLIAKFTLQNWGGNNNKEIRIFHSHWAYKWQRNLYALYDCFSMALTHIQWKHIFNKRDIMQLLPEHFADTKIWWHRTNHLQKELHTMEVN